MAVKVGSTGLLLGRDPKGSEKKDLSPEDKKASRIGRSKAKEAEDIYKKPTTPSLKRRSFESGDSQGLAKDAIEQRQGALWECTGYEPAPYRGRRYKFKSKYTEKQTEEELQRYGEIFPAGEPLVARPGGRNDPMLRIIDPAEENFSPFYREYKDVQKHLFKLGYKYDADHYCLCLPDQEALESGWKKLQEELPDLPDLDIRSSEGIASTIEFVEAYFTHDALLSSGKEFVHDHIFHVLPLLVSLIQPAIPEDKGIVGLYKPLRDVMKQYVMHVYRRVMIVKREMEKYPDLFESGDLQLLKKYFAQAEYHLGAIVDKIATLPSTMLRKEVDGMLKSKEAGQIFRYYYGTLDDRWAKKIEEMFGKGSSEFYWVEDLHDLCDKVVAQVEKRRGIAPEEPPRDE